MDENSALIEQLLREDEEENLRINGGFKDEEIDDDSGWKTVTYSKRKNRAKQSSLENNQSDHMSVDSDVFSSIEKKSEERRRRLIESQKLALDAIAEVTGKKSKRDSDEEDGDDAENSGAVENVVMEVKKPKQKKPKKPKVTVPDAASKVDASDLSAFLADITVSFETQQDIQLMRFADYFARVFNSVSASQFPWTKTFKESPVEKLVDIPLCHISEAVYKESADWVSHKSLDALGSFVLWSLDGVIADLTGHQVIGKGPKKFAQPAPSKSQVAIFVVLAIVLRRKPDVLISLLPLLEESSKYQGQDILPVKIWVIAQAAQGDLAVGLYMWIRMFLPLMSSKSSCNPQSRDLILQLVEKILSSPKARTILVNGAVRKGERLVPPSALELLMRSTFAAPATQIKATERLKAVYPTLKEVALAGSPGSKAMKQVTKEISSFTIKAAGEDILELSMEAVDIFIWCLMQNPEVYKQWDQLYLTNLEANVRILKRLLDDWKELSVKNPSLDPLRETLASFRSKNEKALASAKDAARQATFKEADKYCKAVLARSAHKWGLSLVALFTTGAIVTVGAILITGSNESLAVKKLLESIPFL
ncbi:Transmembrane protein 214 [Dillenia turbinata]|uniref:Transmembrane protein 214 n=1 Tax=Dillenia turbinata TaxID=194707 RepID=A0AAN8ULS6_9MAGN